MTNLELITRVESCFTKKFNVAPVVVFSPGRINLIGEHTDYNDGFVFPAAIDKGIVAAVQKSKTDCCSVYAIDIEEKIEFSIDNIKPLEDGGWRNYVLGVVAGIQKKGKHIDNFNLVFGGNIPDGAGLSSSAALENSIVFGLNELFELGLSKEEMIFISQQAEHQFVGVKCGIMDQYASMYGQENMALQLDCRDLSAIPITIDFKEYGILLINTNVKHSLANSAYNDRRSVCERVAELLKISALRDATETILESVRNQVPEEAYQQALYVVQENTRVKDALQAIRNEDIHTLGKLLYASHKGLSEQYKVSSEELDYLVTEAKNNPHTIGARMMGGGFGGCVIQLTKKNEIEAYIRDIQKAYQEKFNSACSVYTVKLSKGTYRVR